MINITDRPIVLVAGHALHYEISGAISLAEEQLCHQDRETSKKRFLKLAFSDLLGLANQRPDTPFDEAFLQAAYDFSCSDSTNTDAQQAMVRIAKYLNRRTVAATGFTQVKRGLKIALVELWRRKALLLPTLFRPGSGFQMNTVDHEIIRWLHSIDPKSSSGVQRASSHRLYFLGPRLLFTTNWSSVEEVSLDEISKLHIAQLNYSNGVHPHAICGSQFPWMQLPAELIRCFPNRVTFTNSDLVKYSAWSARNATNRGELEIFSRDKQRTHSAKKINQMPSASERLAEDARQISTHDAVLSYFRRLSRRPDTVDWRTSTPSYPGREHVVSTETSQRWIQSFKAFLHHREHIQGYRTAFEVVASLNILADYLFLYLPWWRELFPESEVSIPLAPKDFTRYCYVSRHGIESVNVMPTPLLALIKLRRPGLATQGSCIRLLTLYFRFVGAHFGDDDEIAGVAFRNPMDSEFDMPRLIGKKNKTNKEIIPRNIYGHLLFYCYALEEFGSHLLQQATDGILEPNVRDIKLVRRYETTQFGRVPIFRYRGIELPLHSVPNVFTWAKRGITRNGKTVFVVVPHLTALRLLITSLETGLRCQSVQWLDRTTWDSLNKNAGDQYTYRLFVNTDKTKAEPWTPPIVFRVRRLLQREVAFQSLFVDFDSFEPVLYEGLRSSPFEPVRPVFRSPYKGQPIRDDVYYDAWRDLLVDFEAFYRNASGERHVRMYYLKSTTTADGQPFIKYDGRNANAYCGISVLTVHTPHSCRATFATNRQAQGLLELSDVAELLGHEGIATTAHYTKFSGEQLEERMQRSDVAILGDYSMFEANTESSYLRPDKPESALVQSFAKDRERTVAAFRFAPSVALWSIDDSKMDERNGMELLKNGPMSHIRFRETHICPVGEECPADIVSHIGAPKRCGICPLAMKCIDHLPPIAAKRNQLLERIRYLHGQRKRMEASGEPSSSLDALWDEIQLDINELLGWKFSEELLMKLHGEAERNADANPIIHVDRPDIVRRHLQLVTRQCGRTEFLLHRLAESNAYPSMTSPQVQLAATVLRRRFSAGQGLEDLASLSGENDDVRDSAALLATMMKASGLSMRQVADLLVPPAYAQETKTFLLHSEDANG